MSFEETTGALDKEDGEPTREGASALITPDIVEEGAVTVDIGDVCDGSHDERSARASPTNPVYRRFLKALYECLPTEQEVFLEGHDIKVSITDVERDTRGHPLNPNLYTIQLEHADFVWTVKRRFKHFSALRRHLLLFRAQPRKSFKRYSLRGVPGLPIRPELAVRHVTGSVVEHRKHGLEVFLQKIMDNPSYRKHQETLNFLEVSRFSFVHDLGPKAKEGVVKKRSGGHKFPKCRNCCNVCCYCCACGVWKKRWLVVKDTFVAYIRPRTRELKSVLLFDQEFSVKCGIDDTGTHHGLLLTNQSRQLLCQSWSYRRARDWYDAINEKLSRPAGKAWIDEHRNNSFAPVRDNTPTRWFVCGESYFDAVADALENAEQEIFIMDWWLTPELYLKRHGGLSLYWRLDEILKRKASQGVKVYVCLYKEIEAAVNIGSVRAKQILQDLHPNILVLRHPDHDIAGGTLLWAHHEKIVVVDQRVAFLGGFDLCIGRWDNCDHCLTDLEPMQLSTEETTPDTGITGVLAESTALAFATLSVLPLDVTDSRRPSKVDAKDGGFTHVNLEQTWVGQDYYNPFHRTGLALDQPYVDVVDRREYPRMPWQDIGACVFGDGARDVARHFVHRWNFIKTEKKKSLVSYPLLLPRDGPLSSQHEPDPFKQMLEAAVSCQTQILRSCGEWSSGIPPEQSILNAYLKLIEEAEHVIYIENQFFITSIAGSVGNEIGDALFKRIVRAHKDGKNFKVIVVSPLLPEFDGEIGEASGTAIHTVLHWNYHSMFHGEKSLMQRLTNEVGVPSNYIMFFGLRKHDKLKGVPVTELIYVHSKLMIVDDRKTIIGSANINDRSLTGRRDSEIAVLVNDVEMIESKMDSEVYQVGKFSHSLRMRIFREHLGMVSADGAEEVLCDPVSDQCFKQVLVKTAAKNSFIFDEVFHCLPCDMVTTFSEARARKISNSLAKTISTEDSEKLNGVRGHLVLMPRHFLEAEDLLPKIGTAEALVPNVTFT